MLSMPLAMLVGGKRAIGWVVGQRVDLELSSALALATHGAWATFFRRCHVLFLAPAKGTQLLVKILCDMHVYGHAEA